jgi:leucyl-tRNA synthetase
MKYNPTIIEPKWQAYWDKQNTFAVPRLPANKKLYILDMFPYPSGNGLHVGHPEGYTATDIISRFETMNGKTVLHPMGWDAFGLPAEQQAKKTGIPPQNITETNITNFKRQLKMLGYSYDWNREINTTNPKYFKWTQYIFLLLYDTWFDPKTQKGRPISELTIPPNTPDPELYKNEHRLAYQINAPVNWCPALGTVLSNEEVTQGRSERGNHPVTRIPMRQWMLRITAYADRLESDLEELNWSESIKLLQKNWIGRSTGAEVDFYIGKSTNNPTPNNNDFNSWKKERNTSGFPQKPTNNTIRIYTTRPDTIFGTTYIIIAPEHPLIKNLTTNSQKIIVDNYCQQAASKSELDRTDLSKEKTGVFTGSFAINPLTGKPIPIWVADYVLNSYGTGAIMAVPAHDTRDFEFAKKFNLPILQVVAKSIDEKKINITTNQPELAEAFTSQGTAINSCQYNGLTTSQFKEQITADLQKFGLGSKAVNYKIRDWLFSRQHFWGEPFPILHELDNADNLTGRTILLDLSELPLDIPKGLVFDAKHNSPEPPLEHAPKEWLYVIRNNKKYKRETNTMPQWAGSCWYYLRYIDPDNDTSLIDPELERIWMPVDLYVGGAEHAVLHLLYARFWHKVLFDRGIVSQTEPFQKLVNQGMILGEMEFTGFKDSNGNWISTLMIDVDRDGMGFLKSDSKVQLQSVKLDSKQVMKKGDNFVLVADEQIQVDSRANKMSKSRGNVINPDLVVAEYGADALRLYEMFMGPLESVKPWSMDGVHGVRNFLDRVWKMIVSVAAEKLELEPTVQDILPTEPQNRILHKTIKNVTEDIRNLSFNTAIARMMEFTNFFLKEQIRPKVVMEKFVLLLSPFAPHISEELWSILGHDKTITFESWPSFDEMLIKELTVEVPVSINGKLRSKVVVAAEASESELEQVAFADPKIISLTKDKTIIKKIIVRGKMVNIVIKD